MEFEGIGGASASDKRAKLDKDGNYACKVDAIKKAKSFNAGNKESYVIELTVLESDNPLIRPGQMRSITINRLDSGKPHERERALGNVKGFIAACYADVLGVDLDPDLDHPGDNDPQGWQKLAKQSLLDDGITLKGAKFRVNITVVDTQAGHKFAKPIFSKFANTEAA